MPSWLRGIIALCQIAGGAWMAKYVIAAPAESRWTPFSFLSLGLAAVSIYAGVVLWRGSARGFRVSRIIQGLQVVRIYTGPLLFVVALGPQLLINLFITPDLSLTTHSPVPLPVSGLVGFSAALGLLGGGTWAEVAPTGVGINLFAAFALVALLRGGPARIEAQPAEPLPPR
jgi:hypothetical protein